MFKKRILGETASGSSSSPHLVDSRANKNAIILDYILTHVKGDTRPYLEVKIYGKPILALLDSGSTRTILGSHGWNMLKPFCPINSNAPSDCIVANGQSCQGLGTTEVPIQLKDKVILLEVLVVPSLPHNLILGVDFWSKMGIVPDLYSNEWSFRSDFVDSAQISAIHSIDALSSAQRQILNTFISETFATMPAKLGCTSLVELVLKTDSAPIKQRYYPLSPALQKEVNTELEQMLKDDIIEPSNSPWSSPIVMIKKKTGCWRFCVDYRALNKVTIADSYPLPYVSSILDKLRDARYLSTLDIKSAYWQIPIAEESRPLTAFTVPSRGLFQFKRMPFGLSVAPAVFQRLIDRVVGVDLEQFVFVYLDDVIICTPTFEKHIEVLKEIISRIKRAGLTLNQEKCQFCKSELKYLGYVVNASGLLVDPDKVEAILRIPQPKTPTEVRRIVGMASWYRRFVPDFSTVIAPLTALTRKNAKFLWDSNCEEAFKAIKENLIKAPVLSCPDFNLPFIVQCDASDFGLGAVLSQIQNGEEHVICYLSRSLNKNERRYSTTEKECLAVLFAIEKLRPYLEGTKFTVITDHYSLKWLHSIKDPIGRIARWSVRLQQYNFDIIHRKGKEHVLPDALSRSVPIIDSLECSSESLNPTTDNWYLKMCRQVKEFPAKYPLWWLEDEKLYKKAKHRYPDLSSSDESWLVVVPKDYRSSIIKANHDPPSCGHLGVFKTFSRISKRFYWPGMRQDVAKYIKRCQTCLQTKPLQQQPAGKMLSSQPATSRPWQVISVDLVGPLPRSKSGYHYVFSVCDVFSKFVLFYPLRSATASGIVKWLEDHVILVYGAPEKIIADNGTQFRSKLFKDLVEKYQIAIKYTANYHPQANPVERVHRVLKTTLSAYVTNDQREWDTLLAKVGSAIRSSRHEVTDLTPNFIVYGREIRLPEQDEPRFTVKIPGNTSEDPVSRSEALKRVFIDVQKRLQQAYLRSKHSYDLRRRNDTFSVNQKVWKRNMVLSDASKNFTSKLAPKFTGPYTVRRILSPWTYELVDQNGRNLGIWHAKDLKAHPPDESE